jgi:hypothetical protein
MWPIELIIEAFEGVWPKFLLFAVQVYLKVFFKVVEVVLEFKTKNDPRAIPGIKTKNDPRAIPDSKCRC